MRESDRYIRIASRHPERNRAVAAALKKIVAVEKLS